MIINLKSKNVFVFQDIKIDFTIDSKKLENIKDNDFKEFKNSKKKKKSKLLYQMH